MEEKIYQYETIMPDDYSGILLRIMAENMKIDYNREEYLKALRCDDLYDSECVCVFRDKNNKDRFVMLDTCGPHYIHMFIVRCTSEEHDIIKRKLISIANEMREEEGEDLIDDLKNRFSDDDSAYNKALRRFNLNYL